MSESNTVTIEVYGKEFTIKTSEDPEATKGYASLYRHPNERDRKENGRF